MACRAQVLDISFGITAQRHITTSTPPWQLEGFVAALLCQLCMWAGQQIERGVLPCLVGNGQTHWS